LVLCGQSGRNRDAYDVLFLCYAAGSITPGVQYQYCSPGSCFDLRVGGGLDSYLSGAVELSCGLVLVCVEFNVGGVKLP
jgi:hypothetical protein